MSGSGYALACPEPLAAVAADQIFRLGGNAMDATAAAAFAQGVVNPLMCGIGGDAFLCVYNPSRSETRMLEAPVVIGSRATPDMFASHAKGRFEKVGRFLVEGDLNQLGYRSIMVPGFVAGVEEGFQRFGSRRVSWAQVIAPAERLAREGFVIDDIGAQAWRPAPKPGSPDVLTKLSVTPEAGHTYLKPNGDVYKAGDRLLQRALAETLAQIAEAGGRDFYRGNLALRIAEDMAANDGLFTADDLRGYQIRERSPVWGSYRGLRIASCPPPGAGPTIIQMLQMLEHIDLSHLNWNGPAYLDVLARVMVAAFADAARWQGDVYLTSIPIEEWTSRGHAERRYQEALVGAPPHTRLAISRGTTHVTAIDEEGLVVSLNHSTGSMAASGVITPGLGFLYNNFLGQFDPTPGRSLSIEPGKAAGGASSTIFFRNSRPVLATGSAGGSRLISALVQSTMNHLDHGMSPGEATAVPRIHAEEPGLLYAEPAIDESVVEKLTSWGWRVERCTYMGRVASVAVNPVTGAAEPGSDYRGGRGAIAGARRIL